MLALAVAPAAAEKRKPASLADARAMNRMAMHVHGTAAPELQRLLPAADVLALSIVAEQVAVAASCPARDLDPARFGAVMNRILGPIQDKVDEGRENLVLDVVMGGFSTIRGGALARAGHDRAALCAEGEKMIGEAIELSQTTPAKALLVVKPAV